MIKRNILGALLASFLGSMPVFADGPINSATIPDRLNARAFGARGDAASFQDGVIAASSSTFSSASRPCVAGDVGKAIIVHGSGASGAPQLGTVSSCSGASFVLSFTAATTTAAGSGISGWFTIGTDDTQAVTRAIAAGAISGSGRCVFFPQGSYMLATATTPMPLANTCLDGEGTSPRYWPYTNNGSNLLIFNTTTNSFGLGGGITIKNIAFYYPMQDGYAATPTTYPPLFEGTLLEKATVQNVSFINPYVLMKIDVGAAAGIGDVRLAEVRGYCVSVCFDLRNGMPDVLQISNSFFSSGVYGDIAQSGNNLFNWSASYGEFIHIDVGGGAYNRIDGLMMSNTIVFGRRYGIRVLSGLVDVSNLTGNNWDNVPTVLSVEGNASIITTSISGGVITAVSLPNPALNAAVFNFTSSAQASSTLNLGGGLDISYSMGDVIYDSNAVLKRVTLGSASITAWGQSSTVGTYYGVHSGIENTQLQSAIGNASFICVPSGANTLVGIGLFGGVNAVNDNIFNACAKMITVAGGAAARHRIGGNVSSNTTGTSSLEDTTTGAAFVNTGGNIWDKPSPPILGSGAGNCGTSPTLDGGSDDWSGIVHVGSGANGGQCTLTFNSNSGKVPFVTAMNLSSPTNSIYGAISSNKQVILVGTFAAGDIIQYGVAR